MWLLVVAVAVFAVRWPFGCRRVSRLNRRLRYLFLCTLDHKRCQLVLRIVAKPRLSTSCPRDGHAFSAICFVLRGTAQSRCCVRAYHVTRCCCFNPPTVNLILRMLRNTRDYSTLHVSDFLFLVFFPPSVFRTFVSEMRVKVVALDVFFTRKQGFGFVKMYLSKQHGVLSTQRTRSQDGQQQRLEELSRIPMLCYLAPCPFIPTAGPLKGPSCRCFCSTLPRAGVTRCAA